MCIKILTLLTVLHVSGNCLDLDTFYKFIRNSSVSTVKCAEQRSAFLQGLEDGDMWAIKSKLIFVNFFYPHDYHHLNSVGFLWANTKRISTRK